MRKKIILIIIFIIQALPIPLSLLSWVGTIMSMANIGAMHFSFSEILQGSIAIIAMLLAGTYLITYICSLLLSLKRMSKEQKIGWWCFLPILHGIATVILITLWSYINHIL